MNLPPQAYIQAGMAWWDGLSRTERARWLRFANTSIIAEAYACYLELREGLAEGRVTPAERQLLGAP